MEKRYLHEASRTNIYKSNNEEVQSIKEMKQPTEDELLLLNTIENIYQGINISECLYFKKIKYLVFFILMCDYCYFWIFQFMISPMKNNYYCFDSHSKDFRICDQKEFCEKTGIHNILFTNNPNLTNLNIIEETKNINDHFFKFYLKDSVIFSMSNSKYNKSLEVNSLYSVVIAVTTKEGFSILNTFNLYCNRQAVTIQLIVIFFVTTIIGNCVLGYIADVFGRKKALVISMLFLVCGGVTVFTLTFLILRKGEPVNQQYYSESFQSFDFNLTNYESIVKYINRTNYSYFKKVGLSVGYENDFEEIKQLLINGQFVNKAQSSEKFLLLLGFLLIFLGHDPTINISLAYLMENSVNHDETYHNALVAYLAIPISMLANYIMSTLFDSFHYPIIVNSGIIFILIIIICFFAYESPRYHFEYYNYPQITRIIKSIYPMDETFKKNYLKNPYQEKYKNELSKFKEGTITSFQEMICGTIPFLGFKTRMSKIKDKLQRGVVPQNALIRSPFSHFQFLRTNKKISHNISVIVSLIGTIGIIHYLILGKLTNSLVLQRKELMDNIIVNSVTFYFTIVYMISLYIFNFIAKYLGESIVMFLCFLMIMIFSLAFEGTMSQVRTSEDLNIYTIQSIEISFEESRTTLIGLLSMIIFFSAGLYYSLFLYMTKLTKTAYRCTLYGLFHIILIFTMLFCIAISQYFERNFYYVAVFCWLGVMMTYFLPDDNEIGVVEDFRKINLDELEQ